MMRMPGTNTLLQAVVVTAVTQETDDVKTFTVCYASGGAIPYVSGQFITLAFSHHGREERRSYSVSSCAEAGEQLSFTVKRLPNGGYSRLLIDKLKVGDELQCAGVFGMFTLPQNIAPYEQVFFLAAGIGITPIFSLIKSLLYSRPQIKVVLICSNTGREQTVFYDRLQQLLSQFPSTFAIEFLYSTAYNALRARLNKDLLPGLLREYARCPPQRQLFYICGPVPYMRMVAFSLHENGYHDEQIRKENFNLSDRITFTLEPPDKADHQVTISTNGKDNIIKVGYPDTILRAAQKQGLELPYSCNAGRCGSCVAICKSGKVWMSNNEVLTDTDLRNRMILTCVGHPVGGDVTIEF